MKSFYLHLRSFETYSCIISYCTAFYLSTFSYEYDAVCILASPESIAGGAPNCKMGELHHNHTFHMIIKGPYADHILIPQGSTGSSTFFDIK